MTRTRVRPAKEKDIDSIKALFDRHRRELGFVLRPSLIKAVELGEVLVAIRERKIVGAVHYHHRRDGQTTLYHIAVDPLYRSQRVGRALITRLQKLCSQRGMTCILLKCPAELPSNTFYKRVGFEYRDREKGKHRELNVWVAELQG